MGPVVSGGPLFCRVRGWTFKGHRLIDVRVWFADPSTRELRPGKGLAVSSEGNAEPLFEEPLAIHCLCDEVRKRGSQFLCTLSQGRLSRILVVRLGIHPVPDLGDHKWLAVEDGVKCPKKCLPLN